MSLHLHLLGAFEAFGPDGREIRISSKKNQALLAILATAPGKPNARGTIAALLWSDRPPGQARDSLRQSLAALRRDLGAIAPAALRISDSSLALDPHHTHSDVSAFLQLCSSGNLEDLRGAAALYRGEMLEGLSARDLAFDQWLTQERTRLHDFAIDALERLTPLLDGAAAVEAARRLARLDPTREAANLLLIRAQARLGQTALALRQGRDFRELLKRELGIAPSPAFEAALAAIVAETTGSKSPVEAPRHIPPIAPPGKAVIAIPPLDARAGGAETGFLAAALADNVATMIARAALFSVMTPVSEEAEYHADYLLEGGLQQVGERIRLNARLIETESGRQLWADRYECAAVDFMDAQDRLARSVAASVETQVHLARRDARGLERAGAHDLALRARGVLYDMSAAAFDEAEALTARAIRLDPKHGLAHAILAEAHLLRLVMGLLPHDAENVRRGLDLAATGLALVPEDEWSHAIMALALQAAGRLDEAMREAERALEINPSLSAALVQLGEIEALLGRAAQSIEHCRLALAINPRNPANFWRHATLALAHFAAADHAAMLEEARRVQAWRPDFLRGSLLVAVALAGLGRVAEARRAVDDILKRQVALDLGSAVPRFLPRYAREADHERLIALLRAAGLPAGQSR